LRGIAAALVGHAFFLARSVVEYPQLYSAHFYARGGVTRRMMVFLTEHVSSRALDLGLAAVVVVFLGAALSLSDRVRLRAVVHRHARAVGLSLVALSAIAGVVVLVRRPAPVRAQTRPNVLIIAVDSLRADRIFAPNAATRVPTMAGLARDGVRFRQAYVSQARTFPSFVTLLTGRFPQHHGIRHEFPTSDARQAIGPSLVSALHAAGWRTGAVSDFAGEIFARVPLGLDDVDVAEFNLFSIVEEAILDSHVNVLPYAASRLGERVFPAMRAMAAFAEPEMLTDHAIAELDRLGGEPFFLTVFFSAPHTPYASPAPYYRRFADPAYDGAFRYLKQPLPLVPSLPPADARQVQALYDGALAAVDDSIARLLRRLEERGLAKNTIVVLLGDHGENLFDVPRRGLGHGDHLAGELANQIPLVIVDPTRALTPHDVGGIVRDVDLAPTLGALLGIAAPPGDGVDLAPLLRGEKDTLDLDAFAETGLWLLESGPGFSQRERLPYPPVWFATEAANDGDIFIPSKWDDAIVTAKHRSIRTTKWKLLYQPTPLGPHWRLFDVIADPAELADVAADHPAVVAELRPKLEDWIVADGRTKIQLDAPAPKSGQ
jgi:arylsulfatase A-like enzyme